jgi:hypothetical protein
MRCASSRTGNSKPERTLPRLEPHGASLDWNSLLNPFEPSPQPTKVCKVFGVGSLQLDLHLRYRRHAAVTWQDAALESHVSRSPRTPLQPSQKASLLIPVFLFDLRLDRDRDPCGGYGRAPCPAVRKLVLQLSPAESPRSCAPQIRH